MATKRKHDKIESTRPVLQCIYDSGEWSDLTIEAASERVCPDRTKSAIFKVHKNIVCPASPYFNAACTSGLLEAHTNTIKLPESGEIVEALLRHLYELPLLAPRGEWCLEDIEDTQIDVCSIDHFMPLRIATDKYAMASLVPLVEAAFSKAIESLPLDKLVSTGSELFHTDLDLLDGMRQIVAKQTVRNVDHLVANQPLWESICHAPEYLRRAVQLHKDKHKLR